LRKREDKYVFVSGAACFSFSNVGLRGERGFMKLGQPMEFIHQAVPNFNPDIYNRVAKYFDILSPDEPMWRTNWAFDKDEPLSPFE
jgi:hypothetical protein